MSKKLARSSKNLLTNTIRMVTFSNRKKEENFMWRKYSEIKKRKLQEVSSSTDTDSSECEHRDDGTRTSQPSERPLSYRNKGFKEVDESFSKQDEHIASCSGLASARSDKRPQSPGQEYPDDAQKSETRNGKARPVHQSSKDDVMNTSGGVNSTGECMVDTSFSYGDGKQLIVTSESKPASSSSNGFKNFRDKIKMREKNLSKLLGSRSSSKHRSKKHKTSS